MWKAKNADPERGQTLTAVAADRSATRCIVGVSGGEFGVRGYLTAFDLGSGKQVWKAYSEGPDTDTLIPASFNGPHNAGINTWHGDQWKVGGGTTWGWYSYDPKLDLIYYGTGNPGTWNPTQRPGDNKWSMTVFARRPGNGQAVWARQLTPHDQWDFDGVNEMISGRPQPERPDDSLARALRPQRLRLRARPPQRQAARWPRSSTRRSTGRRRST